VERKGLSPTFHKQAGEARDSKNWVERSVWTERMLERLAQSQEQTVWYSLWDKVWNQGNLNQAILKVILNQGGAGVDGYRTEQLAKEWGPQGDQLAAELKNGSYQPKPVRRAWIPKLGSSELRPLTGKPDAGNPPVRFGGRGGGNTPSLPLLHSPGLQPWLATRGKAFATKQEPRSGSTGPDTPARLNIQGISDPRPVFRQKQGRNSAVLFPWALSPFPLG